MSSGPSWRELWDLAERNSIQRDIARRENKTLLTIIRKMWVNFSACHIVNEAERFVYLCDTCKIQKKSVACIPCGCLAQCTNCSQFPIAVCPICQEIVQTRINLADGQPTQP